VPTAATRRRTATSVNPLLSHGVSAKNVPDPKEGNPKIQKTSSKKAPKGKFQIPTIFFEI
jgi:hypothetical protein